MTFSARLGIVVEVFELKDEGYDEKSSTEGCQATGRPIYQNDRIKNRNQFSIFKTNFSPLMSIVKSFSFLQIFSGDVIVFL